MTQVQDISHDGLKHVFTITIPQSLVEDSLNATLLEIGKTAKVAGFREGKIPMPILKQRYGANARAEALDNAISTATQKALADRKLRPAMQPQIDIVSIGEGKDVEFKLTVEVLPEFTPTDFSTLTLERFVADVEDKVVDEAITRAAKSMREPEAVTDGRAAQMGDVVVIDFDGSIDGTPRPGMKGENHKLELGSHSFIDTFEDQLVGTKVGDKKTVKVTFPADYHAADLANKQAEFIVDVKEIRAPKPVNMDDAMAAEIGFPSLDKLRERIRDDISRNYANVSRVSVKRQLMDKLADAHSFPVPQSMLEAEFNGIWQQVEDQKAKGGLSDADKAKSDEDLRKEYQKIAERRIRLGLLLAEVARAEKIDVPSAELRNALMAEARRFPGQEKAVIDYYTKAEGAIDRLRAPLLEDKVIDHIIAKAKVKETKIAADDLFKKADEADEAA